MREVVSSPLWTSLRTYVRRRAMSEKCRFCCKSRLREATKHDSVVFMRIAARSIDDGPSEE
jgi:hypothetical protein